MKADAQTEATLMATLEHFKQAYETLPNLLVKIHYDSTFGNTAQLAHAMADKLGEHGAEYV
jgi:flavorubredoxin